jgi:hypothetical protein
MSSTEQPISNTTELQQQKKKKKEKLKKVNLTKDGGVVKKIVKQGLGDETPPNGATVFVHYVGTLASGGKPFDSSRDRDEKFSFTLGRGEVIKGWDIGVASMKRGERSILTLTSDYAYGAHGAGSDIPPNATLIFDIELFDWKESNQESDLLQMLMQQQKLQELQKKLHNTTKNCNICSKPAASQCSRCKSVSYCSKECQLADWNQHKTRCVNK